MEHTQVKKALCCGEISPFINFNKRRTMEARFHFMLKSAMKGLHFSVAQGDDLRVRAQHREEAASCDLAGQGSQHDDLQQQVDTSATVIHQGPAGPYIQWNVFNLCCNKGSNYKEREMEER